MDELISRVANYRERFQAWGLAISVLSLFAAIWVRAPTLEISIPLTGGAQASINAGYVIMAGPTIIAFSVAWAIGSLVSMRRYQLAALATNNEITHSQGLTIFGPLVHQESNLEKENIIHFRFFRKIRAFVFFVLPVIVQVVIICTMFGGLHYYSKEKLVANYGSLSEEELKNKPSLGLEAKKVPMLTFFYKEQPESKSHYTIQNSNLNEQCGAFYFLEYLNDNVMALEETQHKIRKLLLELSPKCVPAEFPRFNLALNTWVNLFMFFLTIYLAFLGSRLYASQGLNLQVAKDKQSNQSPIKDEMELMQ